MAVKTHTKCIIFVWFLSYSNYTLIEYIPLPVEAATPAGAAVENVVANSEVPKPDDLVQPEAEATMTLAGHIDKRILESSETKV